MKSIGWTVADAKGGLYMKVTTSKPHAVAFLRGQVTRWGDIPYTRKMSVVEVFIKEPDND